MKITRVILACDDNPIYHQFWNPISKIYKMNFGIDPTLILFGKQSDIFRLGLSDHHGNIIVQPPVLGHHIGWQTAWALFWYMKLYPEDTFITMGIDQIPLSSHLIELAPQPYLDDTYLMLVDDGYAPNHWTLPNGVSPTSFHIVQGKVANKVYGFEPTFEAEIHKVANSGIKAYYGEEKRWGLDESYSSHKLREYQASGGGVISLSMFKEICEKRIECARVNETPYDIEKVKNGWYGDAHLCRPYLDHAPYLDKLLSLIPK